jgi:hypothetical protein
MSSGKEHDPSLTEHMTIWGKRTIAALGLTAVSVVGATGYSMVKSALDPTLPKVTATPLTGVLGHFSNLLPQQPLSFEKSDNSPCRAKYSF